MKQLLSTGRFFLCLLPWISVFFSGGRFLVAQIPPACDQTKHLISDPQSSDRAGSDVDLNNDFLFVGKPSFAGTIAFSTTSGVYIFQPGQTSNNWVEVQVILDPRDDGEESEFGVRLDVSNDCLIVLAPLEDNPAGGVGAAIIYRFDAVANTWAFEAKIFPSDNDPLELRLQGDVSISFDHAIISNIGHTHLGVGGGAAYIFGFDGTSWNEEAELLANDRASLDRFGSSVALVGNVAIVGARLDDDLGIDSGSVYVFKEIAGSWIQTGKITAPDGAAGDWFGFSVDFDGTTLAIGAFRHDSGEPDIGAVYLFQDNGLPGWEFITRLTPPPNEDGRNDFFGISVDIDGDRLAIGASGSASRGSAHVYRDSGTGWVHNARLVAQDFSFGQGFGGTIAIHNENLVIGAQSDRQGGVGAGAFYTHTNILIPDCNANCISDTEELAANPALDCNLNGILDECDVTDGVTLDCNNNGIPDECEDCDNNGIADECDLNPIFSEGSGPLSPIGLGSDANFTFVTPPVRLSDVTFDFTASADMTSTFISIEVFLNGVNIGEVFDSTGTNCADPPDEDQIIVPLATFESLVGTDDPAVLMVASSSDPFACGGTNYVTVDMSYFTPLLIDIDTNSNGVPDSCDLARSDSNLDGLVNVTDLLAMLAAWGLCPGCPEDTNLDGTINVIDLLILLAGWG